MPTSDSTSSTGAPAQVEMDTLNPRTPTGPEQSRSRSSMKQRDPLKKRDYTIGICLLLVVVFLWTSSNFITQDLFEGGYDKPFLLTYLNTSSFTLYLLPFLLRRVLDRRREVKDSPEEVRRARSAEEYQPLVNNPDTSEGPQHSDGHPQVSHKSLDSNDLSPLTVRETAKLAFSFCFFWFIANWSVNASLNYTSVASATILSSLSGFFTLIVGRLFKVEILTIGKIGAVVTSFAGSLLVASSDSHTSQPSNTAPPLNNLADGSGSRPLLGDFLALISAMFYALYVILLKVRIREESRVDMQLFFGFVGLFNILCCWPIGFLLHFIGVERFELPTTQQAVLGILVNMAITLSSDFIYVLAMLKTTPLVVTIGLSLTIPLAVLGDFFLGRPAHGQVLLGAALVLISFIAVGIQSSKANDDLLDHSREPLDDELRLQE